MAHGLETHGLPLVQVLDAWRQGGPEAMRAALQGAEGRLAPPLQDQLAGVPLKRKQGKALQEFRDLYACVRSEAARYGTDRCVLPNCGPATARCSRSTQWHAHRMHAAARATTAGLPQGCYQCREAQSPPSACRANAVLQVLSGYRDKEIVQRKDEHTAAQLQDRVRIATFFVSQELLADPAEGAALEQLSGKWDDAVAMGGGGGGALDGGGAPEWTPELLERRAAMWERGAGGKQRLRALMQRDPEAYFDELLKARDELHEVCHRTMRFGVVPSVSAENMLLYRLQPASAYAGATAIT
jgi:hypothetical protein